MRFQSSTRLATVFILAMTAACGPKGRQYELRGQVLAIDLARKEVTIKHDDIAGFMPAMTMPFRVSDARLLEGRAPGDLVTATLVVEEADAYLTTLAKIGHSEVVATPPLPAASSGLELLKTGETVPDQAFVDQDGRARTLADWRGRTIALTFIYTRCPYPTFCPLMDRQFAAIQQAVKADAALSHQVHLVSVSFDPEHDTPAVLRRHAAKLAADPEVWTFVTGDRDEIDRFAARFGVSIVRGNTPADFTHTLRTAVLDGDGRVVSSHPGNEWMPDDIVRDLRHATTKRGGSAAVCLHAGRAPSHRAAADPGRRAALPEQPALQHRAAAWPRDAAQPPQRRPPPHGALSGGGAQRRGHARAARPSAARLELRIGR